MVKDPFSTVRPVTDEASFIQWLTDGFDPAENGFNNFTNINVTDFTMTGNRIQCNLTATAFGGGEYTLGSMNIQDATNIGNCTNYTALRLHFNQLTGFSPALPLPTTVGRVHLNNNLFTTTSYASMEAWANSLHTSPPGGQVDLWSQVDNYYGTNLETILTGKGWTL